MEEYFLINMKQACILAGTYFGENYSVDELVSLYENEIDEVTELIKEDKEYEKLQKREKISYISDLIIGLRIRNIIVPIVKHVPQLDDEYVYEGYLPEIYDDILDELGVCANRYILGMDSEATLISRVRELERNDQEEVIESYVRKRNY